MGSDASIIAITLEWASLGITIFERIYAFTIYATSILSRVKQRLNFRWLWQGKSRSGEIIIKVLLEIYP
jgi:hypothetical protein